MRKKLFVILGVLVALSMILAACGTPTPQIVEKIVTQEVEKVVTQEVEKIVTQEVVKEVAAEKVQIRWFVGLGTGTDPEQQVTQKKIVDAFNATGLTADDIYSAIIASANLADIGTMTLCLAMAVPFVDETRAGQYLSAALQYADSIVLPSQLPSGAFPNRLWRGHYQTTPYSVATATQASSLALLHAVTGRIEYLKSAQRAGIWLADHVQEDGRCGYVCKRLGRRSCR